MTHSDLYGAFYQAAAHSLQYLAARVPTSLPDNASLQLSAHPEGVVVGQHLYESQAALALDLNTHYLIDCVQHDDELIPDTLGIPSRPPGPEELVWLDYWHEHARSIGWPMYADYAEPPDYRHALRVPNIAAAATLLSQPARSPVWHGSPGRRLTLMLAGPACAICSGDHLDAWYIANGSWWDDLPLFYMADEQPTALNDALHALVDLRPFTNTAQALDSATSFAVHDA